MPDPQAAPARILIADDNPQILELLEAYLEPLGVETLTAVDGDEALQTITTQRPDVLLLDIMMPRRSGYEVCRELKADDRYRDLPVIMVTALHEVGDQERARESGADDFITKPVNKVALLDLVTEHLRRLGKR